MAGFVVRVRAAMSSTRAPLSPLAANSARAASMISARVVSASRTRRGASSFLFARFPWTSFSLATWSSINLS